MKIILLVEPRLGFKIFQLYRMLTQVDVLIKMTNLIN